jgi:hypothetical protein
MFSYSKAAESSIALRSSRQTGDHRVVFSIDSSIIVLAVKSKGAGAGRVFD